VPDSTTDESWVTTTPPETERRSQLPAGRILVGTAAIVLLVVSCSPNPSPAPSPTLSCSAGDSALVRETLYFGRNRPGGIVSDSEWQSFLADVVTPRFPQGLTVTEGVGQWRSADTSAVEQERSEVVTLFHPATEAARRSVHEIALEYKRRFQQEAVLRERAPTCVRLE
jgi:hypothetical protein